MTPRLLFWMLAVCGAHLQGGCRWGGPPASEPSPPPAGFTPAPPDAADSRRELPDAQGRDGSSADAAAESTCQPPFSSAVCDPVCNTGCPTLTRCDVSDTPRTGSCVGIWIAGEGETCFRGSGTDSCAPRLTCLQGRCRRLCYQDSDCKEPAACCTDELRLGDLPSGFKTCTPCPG